MLLQTKFLAPAYNPKSVQRDRLIKRLTPRQGRKLVLISAPAGYGKTTLVSQWLHNYADVSCWLSLDHYDNEPLRFWEYFIGSIAKQVPDFGIEAKSFLQEDKQHFDAAVTALINELSIREDASSAMCLVLDDFHNISNSALLQQFAYLIDFLPDNITIILTTRFEPQLPIARWSVKNWVDKIYAADLVFSMDESTHFLNTYMGLALNEQQISLIVKKTEGWVAAIQLAALSASSVQSQHASSNSEFTLGNSQLTGVDLLGDDRHISDYILTEILEHQPENIQAFLMDTSCLLRLSPELCDYVRQSNDSRELLEKLQQSNLFLIPLDKNHQNYRYHDMFRDALLSKLRTEQNGHYIELQQRAVEWLIKQQQAHEAIHQVIQLKDWPQLQTLLEENGNNLIHEGHHLLVLKWLKHIPEELFSQSPRIIMVKIWALFFSNKIDIIPPLLDELENLIDQQRLSDVETSPTELIDLHSEISLIRAYLARSQSDLKSAGKLTIEVLKELDTTQMPLKSVTYYGIGLDSFAIGNLDSAETALLEAIKHGKREKKYTTVLSSSGLLAYIYFFQGKLETAMETAITNQQWIDHYHDASQPKIISCWQNSALAFIYMEKAEFTIAESYINPLLKHLEIGTEAGQHIMIQYTHARFFFDQHRYLEAIDCLDDAWHVYQHKHDSIMFTPPSIVALKARCLLAMSQVEKAEYIINQLGSETINAVPLNYEDINLTKARIFMEKGHTELALEMLKRLIEQASSMHHIYNLIQALNIKAICLYQSQDIDAASDAIKESLQLASQDGFISVYANETKAILRVLALGADPSLPDAYLQKLTHTLGLQPDQPNSKIDLPGAAALESNKQLLEPLSQREIEVLGLIDQGLANKEIAQKLSLAPATVKAHIRNLYGKIQAKSRTEALSKARAIGLL
ncbi:MAG: LuxR C-terminal-related transcriptional regulator [Oleiphilus sp.]